MECPDFHEFNRVFHCKRRELQHFVKGLAEEKHFKVRQEQETSAKCY